MAEPNNHYKVKLRDGDFELEVASHDRKFVEDYLQTYLRGDCKKDNRTEKELGKIRDDSKELSLAEFVDRVCPSNLIQTLVTIGYFWEKVSVNRTEFSPSDIGDALVRELKMSCKNPSDVVRKAVKARWVMNSSNVDGKYTITKTGIDWVEEKLNDTEG